LSAQLRVGPTKQTKTPTTTLVAQTFHFLADVNMMNSPKDIGEA